MVGGFLAGLSFSLLGIMGPGVLTIATIWGLAEIAVAALAVGWLYREPGG